MSDQGINFSALYLTSDTIYTKRPAANRRAARAAWDDFEKDGPVEWIRLLDGYWGCQRPGGGHVEEVGAIHYRREWWLS